MRETDHIDAIPWRRLTPEEQQRRVTQIIEQAHLARAQALSDLLRLPLRLVLRAGAAVWRTANIWWTRRRAIRDLCALDDRTLRDIGLGRSEILAAVEGRGPARATGPVAAANACSPHASERERTPARAA